MTGSGHVLAGFYVSAPVIGIRFVCQGDKLRYECEADATMNVAEVDFHAKSELLRGQGSCFFSDLQVQVLEPNGSVK